jgi:hypothetical protein
MKNCNAPSIGHVFTIDHFNLLFNTPAVFAYYFALYPADEIARRFEFNEKLQGKRADAIWALEQCAKNSGYTLAYYIACVKTSIVRLCSARDQSLNTLDLVVKRIESGTFNTYSFAEIKKAVVASDLDHSHQYNLDIVDRWIPDWAHDFYGLIIDHTDAFDETPDVIIAPDPTVQTPGTTPSTTTTATSTASFGKYALPILGVGLLLALFSKKKK